MTGADRGFVSYSVYYSPSSGSHYGLFMTQDEWATPGVSTGIGGGGGMGCCSFGILAVFPPSTLLYQNFDQGWGSVRSITIEGLETDYHTYSFGGDYSVKGASLSDTTFLAAVQRYYPEEGTYLYRVSPSSSYYQAAIDSIMGPGTYPVAVDVFGSSFCSIVGQIGVQHVRLSSDEGSSWVTVLSDADLRCAAWGDANTLWLGGLQGSVKKSSDLGQSWNTIPFPSDMTIAAIDAYSADSVWVGGSGGQVFATGDGGQNWIAYPTEDTTITRIQAFPGALYVYTQTGVIRRFSAGPTSVEELPSVTNTEVGFLAHAGQRPVSGIQVLDAAGRPITPNIQGRAISMLGKPAGIYIVLFRADDREFRSKACWLGD